MIDKDINKREEWLLLKVDSAQLLLQFQDAQKTYEKYANSLGPLDSISLYYYNEMQMIAVEFTKSFIK